jgi:cell division protein FtsQ
MANRTNIQSITKLALWVLVGGLLLWLIVSATGYNNNKHLQSININLGANNPQYFVSKTDVTNNLLQWQPNLERGLMLDEINTQVIEQNLLKNPWIHKAEVFIDNENILQVTIYQSRPLAKIFTTNGAQYYMDTAGKFLPTVKQNAPRLPVITNYPMQGNAPQNDSLLKIRLIAIGNVFAQDSFWQAQLGQIDIENSRLVLIPTLGNHEVHLGYNQNIEEICKRLKNFYKQYGGKGVYTQYEKIIATYENQLVAVKKPSAITNTNITDSAWSYFSVWDKPTVVITNNDSLRNSPSSTNQTTNPANRPAANNNRTSLPAARNVAPANRNNQPRVNLNNNRNH